MGNKKLPFLAKATSLRRWLAYTKTLTTTNDQNIIKPTTNSSTIINLDYDKQSITNESFNSTAIDLSGFKSDRLFFEPGDTNSILELAKPHDKESAVFATVNVDSTNPFVDFRASIVEMVEACDHMKEWENLEELLTCYLSVNERSNHGYIIAAFMDLLLHYRVFNTVDERCSCSFGSSAHECSFTSSRSFFSCSGSSTN